MNLSQYMDDAIDRRHDCCTFMSGWLLENGISDPMKDRRGTYSGPDEYLRLLKDEGGILASCARRFAAVGMSVTKSPKAGDVAIVRAPLVGATGAICVSETMRAVVASDAALVIAELPDVRVWTFRNG